MKKLLTGLLAAVTLLGCGAALAVGGSRSDPLISLKYLTDTYAPDVLSQAQDRVNSRTQPVYNSAKTQLDAIHKDAMKQLAPSSDGQSSSHGFGDQRYKQGDVISLPTGSGVMLLAGQVTVSYSGGAVVDTTSGTVLPSGSPLSPMHRYLAAENTTAVLSVSSETAVLSLEGSSLLSPSGALDYNALAFGLQDMGLFAGTGTAYGGGLDLEKIPTRIEGLIMFLRLIGEEQNAQAYTGTSPFTDLPDWCTHYVAYAYSKGYTAGAGFNAAGKPIFAPLRPIGAGEYLTFIMRALGYRDSGENLDFTWKNVLPRSLELGVITPGEYQLLTSSTLRRAHVAYLSYFAMDIHCVSGETLLQKLDAAGALKASAVQEIRSGIPVTRLS